MGGFVCKRIRGGRNRNESGHAAPLPTPNPMTQSLFLSADITSLAFEYLMELGVFDYFALSWSRSTALSSWVVRIGCV